MKVNELIDEINMLTDDEEARRVYTAAYDRWRWCAEEKHEDKRKELLYQAMIDFPLGSRVKVVNVYYSTLTDKTGVVKEFDSTRGYTQITAHVQLDKGKGPQSLQCAVHGMGSGCIRLIAAVDTTSGYYHAQLELI